MYMEHIIQLVIVLFTLSIVFERLIDFLKQYLSCRKLFGQWFWVGDTTTKYASNSVEELRRHYRILKLNLSVGFITAVLCHANLFELLGSSQPGKEIGWALQAPLFSKAWWDKIVIGPQFLLANIYWLLGCLLAGAFISLGSKVWHDLLDLLLLAKDARRTAFTAMQRALDFSKLGGDEQLNKIQAAIAEYSADWQNSYPELTGVGISNKIYEQNGNSSDQKVIQFHVVKKLPLDALGLRLPGFVDYFGYRIPTDIVEAGRMTPSWLYDGSSDLPRRCGASISRSSPASKTTGTIGLKVSRTSNETTRYYLLTCCHVAMASEMSSGPVDILEGEQIIAPEIDCPGQLCNRPAQQIGQVVEARLSEHTDSALISLDFSDAVTAIVNGFHPISGYRSIVKDDINKLTVGFCGAASGIRTNILVRGYKLNKTAIYPPLTKLTRLSNLIALNRCTQEGDSGAAVLDVDNRIVGMIVGQDESFTYVIPIQQIRAQHSYFNCVNI